MLKLQLMCPTLPNVLVQQDSSFIDI